jgi:hypothetical protein
MLTLASKRQHNGKQSLTEIKTAVSTSWRKRHRPPKKKMEKQAQLKTNELHSPKITTLMMMMMINIFLSGV